VDNLRCLRNQSIISSLRLHCVRCISSCSPRILFLLGPISNQFLPFFSPRGWCSSSILDPREKEKHPLQITSFVVIVTVVAKLVISALHPRLKSSFRDCFCSCQPSPKSPQNYVQERSNRKPEKVNDTTTYKPALIHSRHSSQSF